MNPIEVHHNIGAKDQHTMAVVRAQSALSKGTMTGPEARPAYDALMAAIPAATDVTYTEGNVGGVTGLWCKAPGARADSVLLYLHGGGYVLGTAASYKSFVSQLAARAETNVFIPDYGLAPEHPYPAAVKDARLVWHGLQAQGFQHVVIVGDSAGGGLSLSLLHWASSEAAAGRTLAPVACVVMSPWTDLALTGPSFISKVEEDPFVTEANSRSMISLYLGSTDPKTPEASPLYGNLAGLPAIQMHVGTSEMLMDDTLRYAAGVEAAGGQVTAHVWQGMPHVFPTSFPILEAGEAALQIMAAFISEQFAL